MKSLSLKHFIWMMITRKKQIQKKELELVYQQIKDAEKFEYKKQQEAKFYSNGYLTQLLSDSQYNGTKKKEFELA